MFENVNTNFSLSEKIEEAIVNAIRQGKLSAGEKLPTEVELCKQFSVSRTAVREAISKLNARGLITVRKGSGTYVSEISIDQAQQALNLFFELSTQPNLVFDTISARRMIEPSIAAFAARVRKKEHIYYLEQNLEDMIACDIEDLDKEAELDNAFHSGIIKSTGNEVLTLLLRPVYNLMPQYRQMVFAKNSHTVHIKAKDILIGFHGDILNAIKSGDSEKAFQSMTDHLAFTETNYLEHHKRV